MRTKTSASKSFGKTSKESQYPFIRDGRFGESLQLNVLTKFQTIPIKA
jgi:hypothetical protein